METDGTTESEMMNVLQRTGLTSVSHLLSRRRSSAFGHLAPLDDVTPANMALHLHINVSHNRTPDRTWYRPPGRPRNKWLHQLRNDSICPIGDLWRRAVDRGHGGATTQRPSLATKWVHVSIERRQLSAVSGAPSMERELIQRCVGRAPSVER